MIDCKFVVFVGNDLLHLFPGGILFGLLILRRNMNSLNRF